MVTQTATKWDFHYKPFPDRIDLALKGCGLSKTAIHAYHYILGKLNGKTKSGWTIAISDREIANYFDYALPTVRVARRELVKAKLIEQKFARTKDGIRLVGRFMFRLLINVNKQADLRSHLFVEHKAQCSTKRLCAPQIVKQTSKQSQKKSRSPRSPLAVPMATRETPVSEYDSSNDQTIDESPDESPGEPEKAICRHFREHIAHAPESGETRSVGAPSFALPQIDAPEARQPVDKPDENPPETVEKVFSGAQATADNGRCPSSALQRKVLPTPSKKCSQHHPKSAPNSILSDHPLPSRNPDIARLHKPEGGFGIDVFKDVYIDTLSPKGSLSEKKGEADNKKKRESFGKIFSKTVWRRVIHNQSTLAQMDRYFQERVDEIAQDNRIGNKEAAREILIRSFVELPITPHSHTIYNVEYGDRAIEKAIKYHQRFSSPVNQSDLSYRKPSSQVKTVLDAQQSSTLHSNSPRRPIREPSPEIKAMIERLKARQAEAANNPLAQVEMLRELREAKRQVLASKGFAVDGVKSTENPIGDVAVGIFKKDNAAVADAATNDRHWWLSKRSDAD